MSEVVDIVVRENGSEQAAANIRKVGASSAEGQARLAALAQQLRGNTGALQDHTSAVSRTEQAVAGAGRAAATASGAHKAHGAEMSRSAELANHLRETMVALGLALGVHEWIELTDAYQLNINGLKQVTTSQENLIATQTALKEISNETFSDLNANTTLYVRLAKAGKDLNVTQTEMLTVVRVLNDGLRLAGNTSSDAGRAISQLSVAMMTGEGSSRAMLSIMRQMPDLTQALATKFFTGKDAVLQFKQAVEGGTIPIQQVIKGIASLSSTQGELSEHMNAATQGVKAHGEALQTDAEKSMIAAGRMFDLSHVTGETNKNVVDLSHSTESAGHAGIVATSAFQSMGHAVQTVNGASTAFEQQVKKLEPTVVQAWGNMKNALFTYVGEADQASGASEKIAHVLEFVAHNGQMFFGVLTVITAFLGTYVAAAGVAYVATLLFVTAFSPLHLVISLIAAAAVAFYTFGQNIKLTSDGSITALGALKAVLDFVRQGIVFLWQASLPVFAAIASGIEALAPSFGVMWSIAKPILGMLISLIGLLGTVAQGMWKILQPILTGIGVVLSYVWAIAEPVFNGLIFFFQSLGAAAATLWGLVKPMFDGFAATADTLTSKLTPAFTGLVDKMKEFSIETVKAGTAGKDFGNTWGQEIAKVTDGFQDGLIPAIKQTSGTMDALKNSAVADMSQTAASVNSVTSALAQMASEASSAGAATGSIKGPSGVANTGGATSQNFTTWHLEDKENLHDALFRASQISMGGGGKGVDAESLVGMLDGVQRNKFDSKNQAEALQSLSGLSGDAKAYLKSRLTPFALPIGFAKGGSFTVGGAGGTDSQLVQFLASPDETVEVKTPAQQRGAGAGAGVNVHMYVQATDAASFSRTSHQIVSQLESQLNRVAMRG